MTGADVADWQRFLTIKGVFHEDADGVFGPATVQATRDYQSTSGLQVDGVVGSVTFALAASEGLAVTVDMSIAGMDASVNCAPFAEQIAAAGMKFVGRYYSDSPSKTLTLAEAHALSGAGLNIIAVFEDVNNVIDKFSQASGQSNARKALQLAQTIGQPASTAIYFAVDFDPTAAEVAGPVTQYFQAIQQVFTAAPVAYFIGVYGSGLTCRVIRDAGLAKFTWLSCSTGFAESATFRSQADIIQSPSRTILGGELNIDDDVAQSADFGAFSVDGESSQSVS